MSKRFQKNFDRLVLFRYFTLWNDSFGLAYLTINEVSAKPMYFLASPSLLRKSFEKGRLTYIRDSTCNRELKRKLQQVLFERAMLRPCAQNHGSQITTKTTTSMKIAVRQMMLGRQAACMCVSVDSSHGTVHTMSTSIPVHLIGYTDLFFFDMNYRVVFGGWFIFGVDLYSGKCSIYIYIYIYTQIDYFAPLLHVWSSTLLG